MFLTVAFFFLGLVSEYFGPVVDKVGMGFVSESLRCVYLVKHRTDYRRDNHGLVKEIA
jgi:hypothetical protein